MELDEACTILGVEPGSERGAARASFRRLLRSLHPDVAPASTRFSAPEANAATRRVIDAYRTWSVGAGGGDPADDAGHDGDGPVATGDGGCGSGDGFDRDDVLLIDGDTLRLPFPAHESFLALLRAAHEVGSVTYIDRESELLEALVRAPDGATISVVVSLQGRARGTDAFFTLEPLRAGTAVALRVEEIVEAFAAAVARG